MSEDRMIHRELTSPTSKRQKNERDPTHQSEGYIIAVYLGILFFLFLVRTTGLGYMYFQLYCICKTENCPARNDTSSTEDHTHSNLPTYTEKDCDIHHGQWSCCGKSCYYFSTEQKTWDESKKSCQQLGYDLIKIDDLEEQKFTQSKISNSYWVGIHKKGANHPWLWQDGTTPSWRLHFQPTTSTSETCGRIMKTDMINTVCTTRFHYICEKPSI